MLLLQAPLNMKGKTERPKELGEEIKTGGLWFLHTFHLYFHFVTQGPKEIAFSLVSVSVLLPTLSLFGRDYLQGLQGPLLLSYLFHRVTIQDRCLVSALSLWKEGVLEPGGFLQLLMV